MEKVWVAKAKIKAKRKLLEFDVMVGLSEIQQGKGEIFKSAKDLFRKLR